MKGRKPKPTALKRAQGNPGKRKLHDEPCIASDIPDCPSHLTPFARQEWARISILLHTAGVLKVTDRAALAAYCQSWGDWCDARVALSKISAHSMRSKAGLERWKLYWRVANAAADQMRRWAVELGLTPSARARVKAEPPAREMSLAELLFAGADVSVTNG